MLNANKVNPDITIFFNVFNIKFIQTSKILLDFISIIKRH